MALADSRRQRICMLCAMYFAQGVPWGFMVTALMAYLADRGVGDAQLGELTAVVLLPWTFKLVWGPLIDSVTIRSMGRRRPWIIGAELMMAISLLGILALGDLSGNLQLLGWMFFLHNCFASLQDVATDALAIDVLPPREQGQMNGLMWGSKLVGKAIGASAMASIISLWGLPAAVLAQVIILMIIMLFPLLILERAGEKLFPWSTPKPFAVPPSSGEDASKPSSERQIAESSNFRNPVAVLKDLARAFSLVSTAVFVLYGSVHVIGWGIVEVITKPLYTQQLGWDYVQVSNVSGAAVIPEMLGALLGGWLADRFGRRKVMVAGFGTYGLLAAIFAMSPSLWQETWFAAGYLLVNPAALAMGAVGFLSMGMRIAWTTAAATMFTIYMTMSNLGHVLGNHWVGTLREGWGLSYEQTFWVAAFAMWLPLLCLPFVNPEHVDRRKDREREQADAIAQRLPENH